MAEVLQCDRDAAADYLEFVDAGQGRKFDNLRSGSHDDEPFLLAMAAHREAAEKAVIDWLRGPAFGEKADWNVAHSSEFAAAIERGDHRKG